MPPCLVTDIDLGIALFPLGKNTREIQSSHLLELKSIHEKTSKSIPLNYIYHSNERLTTSSADSNGMSCGLDLSQAIENGCNELVERHIFSLWLVGDKNIKTSLVSLDLLQEVVGDKILNKMHNLTKTMRVFELKFGQISCFLATSFADTEVFFCYGTSVNRNPSLGIMGAIGELNQTYVNSLNGLVQRKNYTFLYPLRQKLRNKIRGLVQDARTINEVSRGCTYIDNCLELKLDPYVYEFKDHSFPFIVVKCIGQNALFSKPGIND